MENTIPQSSALKKLNLGCGHRYHGEWTNVDFSSTGPGVIAHNLLQGIPFPDQQFDVVYHSHVLEHFSRTDGERFIAECYRVLRPGGVIRIAVPDLERIVREYLSALERGLRGEPDAGPDYDWIMLELFDQTVRTTSGGDMARYLAQKELPNESFVFERVGEEARRLRGVLLRNQQKASSSAAPAPAAPPESSWRRFFKPDYYRTRLKNYFLKEEEVRYRNDRKYAGLGKFRLGGEIHQWMYDRYSLARLLGKTGFGEAIVRTAVESSIPGWTGYELDASREGMVFKPDSLFMEAKRPA